MCILFYNFIYAYTWNVLNDISIIYYSATWLNYISVCMLATVWLRWVYSVAPAYIFAKKQPINKWYSDIKQKQNWKSAERRREESVMVNKYDLECFEQRKLKVLRLLCLEKGEDN